MASPVRGPELLSVLGFATRGREYGVVVMLASRIHSEPAASPDEGWSPPWARGHDGPSWRAPGRKQGVNRSGDCGEPRHWGPQHHLNATALFSTGAQSGADQDPAVENCAEKLADWHSSRGRILTLRDRQGSQLAARGVQGSAATTPAITRGVRRIRTSSKRTAEREETSGQSGAGDVGERVRTPAICGNRRLNAELFAREWRAVPGAALRGAYACRSHVR